MILCKISVAKDQRKSSTNQENLFLNNLDDALGKNTEKRQVHFGHSQNMAVLARQLQNVHTEKDRQVSSVLNRASIQEQAMLKANK